MVNANSPEYWDKQWSKKVKKFPAWTMNRVKWLIPNGSSVLDIGCGNGTFLRTLRDEKQCKVFGIDISAVAVGKMIELGIDGLVWSAEQMDDFPYQFDYVVATHIFEHIENDVGLIKNIARIAKCGAIIAVPNDCSYPEPTGEHIRKYTRESLNALIAPYFTKIEDKTLRNHLIFKATYV